MIKFVKGIQIMQNFKTSNLPSVPHSGKNKKKMVEENDARFERLEKAYQDAHKKVTKMMEMIRKLMKGMDQWKVCIPKVRLHSLKE